MISERMYSFTHCNSKLSRLNSSVHYGNTKRIDMAVNQAKKEKVSIAKIIDYTNEFLEAIDIQAVENPKITDLIVKEGNYGPKTVMLDYGAIRRVHGLNNEKHLVWMKFTKDGYLGLVAASNDCNFDIPPNSRSYNETSNGKEKNRSNLWKYTTSGILIHQLGKVWDENFLLVFPLKGIGDAMRHDVECGIGQYLIRKGVPVLDYYSHTF